jgi:hypothetical protein
MVNLSIIEPIKQVLLKQKPEISLESIDKICDEFPCFHAAFVLKAILLKDEKQNLMKLYLKLPLEC